MLYKVKGFVNQQTVHETFNLVYLEWHWLIRNKILCKTINKIFEMKACPTFPQGTEVHPLGQRATPRPEAVEPPPQLQLRPQGKTVQ